MDYKTLNYNCHYLQSNINNKTSHNNPNIKNEYIQRMFAGKDQQARMIADKRKSLDRALMYSYQRAFIKKLGEDEEILALINPNKLKQDYDDKILSVNFEHNFKPGDVFEWGNTHSHWLIYLQDLTELAYFRGSIRRCRYQARWKDEDGNIHQSYMAVRGPVETKINFIQKSGISVDNPNYSLNILMPKTEDALNYFKRYSTFYLLDTDFPNREICWRVLATDSISTPGILEIVAMEYYSNEFEDDVENGIVDGLIPTKMELIANAETAEDIIGDIFIKPKKSYTYKYIGDNECNWEFDNKLPITIISQSKNEITLKWEATYSGSFDLKCGDYNQTIVVESLF